MPADTTAPSGWTATASASSSSGESATGEQPPLKEGSIPAMFGLATAARAGLAPRVARAAPVAMAPPTAATTPRPAIRRMAVLSAAPRPDLSESAHPDGPVHAEGPVAGEVAAEQHGRARR